MSEFKPRGSAKASPSTRRRTQREHYFEMDIFLRAGNHEGEHVVVPPAHLCRLCVHDALAVAVADGSSDEEILDFHRAAENLMPRFARYRGRTDGRPHWRQTAPATG